LQHNYWYQIGPFGGNVTDISLSKNSSEIAVVTQAGASAFNYDWLDVENGGGISNVEYYSSPNRQFLLVLKKNQLLSTFDYGYHWKLVFSVQDSLTGLSISQIPSYPIFIWSDSIIFKGNLDSTQWDSIYPHLGKITSLLPDPIDSSLVYLGTSTGLYKSTDAGLSWDVFALLKKPINSISIAEVFPGIIYVSNTIDNYIYTSSDNGASWDSSNVGLPTSIYNPIRAVTCSPSVNGMAFAATNDGIYKTVNAGAVWFKFSNQLSFLDSGTIKTLETNTVKLKENKIYCGTPEGLFQADVLTDLWQQFGPYNEKVLSITKNIFNYDNQLIIGTPKGIKYQNYSAWSPSQLYSQAGPAISKVVSSHDYYNQFFLAATDNKNNKSIIYRSTDNGINWDSVFSLPNESCHVESFYQRSDSSNIIFILVSNQNSSYGLYRSDQYGIKGSWFQIESSFQKNFISAANNSNSDTLFFLIDNNQLYLSTDGGINITYLSTIPGNRFNYLYVSNRNNIDPIYVAGQGVKRSFDYLTWEDFGLDTIEVIELTEDWSSLFAATRYNGIFTNFYYAGEWYPFNNGLATKEITDIVNFTHSIMHVATANNSVYIIYSIINEADKETSGLPENFELYQNYPNPFNPSTRIRYQVASSSKVSLKVFDMIGNEITTLVNEYKPAGSFEVNFDASKLSSGVYFYRLNADSFVETKKMILLR
jgi:hypothetical protein